MRIISWNINGIRSGTKDVARVLSDLNADIACFQETKLSKDQLTEALAVVDGYRSYFSFCRTKAGYSGVVTFCRRVIQPINAVDSLTTPLQGEVLEPGTFSFSESVLKSLDCEGRAVITQHIINSPSLEKKVMSIVNLYCPCVTGERDGREQFRLQFLQLLEERVKSLMATSYVILAGDLNVAHKIIDHCDPGEEKTFLNEPQRLWFNRLVDSEGSFIDTYRSLHPDKKYAYTCWNTRLNCRLTNFGTRIDYILLDKALNDFLKNAEVISKYVGSDHCPVSADLCVEFSPSNSPPELCSSRRFTVRQQKLTMFVSKRVNNSDTAACDNSDPKRKAGSISPSIKEHPYQAKENPSSYKVTSPVKGKPHQPKENPNSQRETSPVKGKPHQPKENPNSQRETSPAKGKPLLEFFKKTQSLQMNK